MDLIQRQGERLDGAWLSRERIAPAGDLSLPDAYAVQAAVVARRLARGERIAGMKMGLTSRAKMRQMGVDTPIYGWLTSAMQLGDGATVPTSTMVAPRIEPEIAFILARDLSGPVTPVQAIQAVAGVCGALEIIDSRYRDFKFSLPDVIADNASSAYFVLGSELAPPQNLESRGMIMELNGRIVQTGCSAAIFEHPA
ncbi:MAG: 2-keto-4-pentenoate hydratase, partial [Candidatus Xenobia bacterium]